MIGGRLGLLGRCALAAAVFWMLLPLLVMAAAAFNASNFPAVLPWRGFTLQWFVALGDEPRLTRGALNGLVLSLCTTALIVPMALAGALLLDRRPPSGLTVVFAVLVSPILIPGLIFGVATLVFWSGLGFRPGLFIATLANAGGYASTLMLLLLARLGRFDPELDEAARDLGATPWQCFRLLLLPWLRPTLIAGTAIAFLQVFDSFNLSMFTIGTRTTLPIEIGARVRSDLRPTLNALAVLILLVAVAVTVWSVRARLSEPRSRAPRPARAAAPRAPLRSPRPGAASSVPS